MIYSTEDDAVRAAQSMTEAARDARAVISYRVYRVAGGYRVTDRDAPRQGPRHTPCPLLAWFHSDGERVKRFHVGR